MQIVLDGELGDWDGQTGIRADSDELFICFETLDDSQALQAANFTTRIRIDVDGDVKTGDRRMFDHVDPKTGQSMALSQGVDVVVDISPISLEEDAFAELTGGTRISALGNSTSDELSHTDIGFYFLPTHNSPRYEARFDRGGLGLVHDKEISVVIEHLTAGGDVLKTQYMTSTMPRYASPKQLDVSIPDRPEQGVRVMAANVLYSAPLENPDPFDRQYDAIDPDVILFQEWFKTTQDQVEGWVDSYLGQEWSLPSKDE